MSNEELQKAIDDITNENAASDAIAPAVPDVEAPAVSGAMPEGMMPEAVTPAAAMPASDAAVAAVADPIAAPAPAPEVPMPEVAAPAPAPVPEAPVAPAAPANAMAEVALPAEGLLDNAVPEKISNMPNTEPPASLIKVEQDTLRELFPLMNKLNIDPVQKFGIYKDIIALTHEQSAIEEAHATVQQIEDEQVRADALLELLQIIAEHKQ